MVSVRVVSHPPMAVMVTVQSPGHNPVASACPWPFGGTGLQRNVKGGVPPLGARTMLPSQTSEHVASVTVALGTMGGGAPIVKSTSVSQPSASVINSV